MIKITQEEDNDNQSEFLDNNNDISSIEAKLKQYEDEINLKDQKIKEFENKTNDLTTLNSVSNNKINELKDNIREQTLIISELRIETNELKYEIEQKNTKIDDIEKQILKINNKIKNEAITNQKKVSESQNELETKEIEIISLKEDLSAFNNLKETNENLKSELEKQYRENEDLNQKINDLQKTNDMHLNTIADLKLNLKQFKDKEELKGEFKEKISEQMIELKKEVKVLRRERDHYKEIIKEKKLL